jgi:primosomal protein N' (replication factor Y)
MTALRLVDVVVNLPLGAFTYAVPADWPEAPPPGTRVFVPFGPRRLTGLVIAARDTLPPGAQAAHVKPLLARQDETPALDEGLLALVRRVADYYAAPLGMAAFTALPPGSSRQDEARLWLPADAVLPADAPAWLEGLRGEPAASLRALERRTAAPRTELEAWARRGVLQRRREERAASARERVIRVVTWLGGEVPERARARRAVAEVVREAGSLTLPALRERLGDGATAHVKALADAGIVRVDEQRTFRDPFGDQGADPASPPPILTGEQAEAVEAVGNALEAGFATFLLHGITGSGKTEVYLHVIRRVLDQGRGALVLVPEIALTPQLSARFRARFGERVAVLHSALTPGERLDQWDRLRSGDADVAVGARSAVFAPLASLGLIVVDEEHDGSYKQGDGLRYHARDVALLRGQLAGCPVVLGSATPSLESLANAWRGRSRLLTLAERPTGAPLPTIEMIDLKSAELVEGADFLSRPLLDAVLETTKAGRQVILFHNRRGHSPFQLCLACGHVPQCRECGVALTWHQSTARMICHACGASFRRFARCPECASDRLELRGVGTERIEEALALVAPHLSVLRYDADAVRGRSHARLLADFRAGRYAVMVGTQMVTKGHDFPNVHLVGVVLAEHGLKFPDFRAAETALQRLVQVAGRAGRTGERGRVLVQTYAPEHYALGFLLTHDWLGFARYELELRRERGWPPLGHLVLLELRGGNAVLVERDLTRVKRAIEGWAAARGADVRPRGPVPAPLRKVQGAARYHLLLAAPTREPLRALLRALPALAPGLELLVDVDPHDLM